MKKKQQENIDEAWMNTYGDMVTLLLCFFVMMAAVSKVDVAKYEMIQAGMREGVGKVDVQRPIEMMMVELADDIQSMNMEDKVALGSDTQGVVLELGGGTFFEACSAEINQDAFPALKRMVATLQSERYSKFVFSIEGHTSNQKCPGDKYPSNWELSSLRAASVARFFEERGVPRTRIKAIGFDDTIPKYPNLDPFGEPIPKNQALNNRIVIHIEPLFK